MEGSFYEFAEILRILCNQYGIDSHGQLDKVQLRNLNLVHGDKLLITITIKIIDEGSTAKLSLETI